MNNEIKNLTIVINGFSKSHSKISDSLSFAERLLEEERVAVVPGIAFGKEGYLRISFTTSLQEIEEGVRRLKSFLDST